ncbi:hypothetical protein [Pararobbsia alpina]|uniref:hypothetical protein n=1 Tax=Pararobbsia alpina TaxID=621374 RepID=UPI0039A4A1E3
MALTWVPPIPFQVETLHLAGNALTEVPDGLPRGLKTLDVSNNALTRIPAGLPAGLRHLRAARNTLRSIETLPRWLESLDVSHNRLIDLPNAWPPALARLDASSNLLDRFPDALPRRLRGLDLSDNLLDHLPRRLPGNLTDFRVDHNETLTALPAFQARCLRRLSASACNLEALPASLPASLRALFVSNNRLTRVSAISGQLRILDLSDNAIEDVRIPEPLRLERVSLRGNRLMTVPHFVGAWRKTLAFRFATMKYVGEPAVRHVDLSDNPFVSRATSDERMQLDSLRSREASRGVVIVHLQGDALRREFDRMRRAPMT